MVIDVRSIGYLPGAINVSAFVEVGVVQGSSELLSELTGVPKAASTVIATNSPVKTIAVSRFPESESSVRWCRSCDKSLEKLQFKQVQRESLSWTIECRPQRGHSGIFLLSITLTPQ